MYNKSIGKHFGENKMTLAQQYETLIKNLLLDFSEEALDQLEEFGQKNMISHGMLDSSGWSSNTRIFRDASIYGLSDMYYQRFSRTIVRTDFHTTFQQ